MTSTTLYSMLWHQQPCILCYDISDLVLYAMTSVTLYSMLWHQRPCTLCYDISDLVLYAMTSATLYLLYAEINLELCWHQWPCTYCMLTVLTSTALYSVCYDINNLVLYAISVALYLLYADCNDTNLIFCKLWHQQPCTLSYDINDIVLCMLWHQWRCTLYWHQRPCILYTDINDLVLYAMTSTTLYLLYMPDCTDINDLYADLTGELTVS